MTPQERERVADLFDRLARLESAPREREAEEMIAEGLRQAPHSPYAMVQTILVQEEALERANERIRELEAQIGGGRQQQSGGFLDSLRGALSGQPAAPARGSVPATRPMGTPPSFRRNAYNRGQEIGRGGSFLGQAASIAAGVVVGSMVVDALRGQFGSDASGTGAEATSAPAHEASHQDAGYETANHGDGGFDSGGDFGGGDFGGGDFA